MREQGVEGSASLGRSRHVAERGGGGGGSAQVVVHRAGVALPDFCWRRRGGGESLLR